jgi:single-stranded-DNA-specific exonuclease
MDIGADAVPAFREAFRREARRALEGSELRPKLKVDLELAPRDATLPLVERLRYLGPHGMGNPRPVFLGRALELAEPARVVGSGHLKVRLRGNGYRLDGIGFRMAERVPPETLGAGPVDAVFQLTADEYRGHARVQAKLLDVRRTPPAGHG